MKVLLNKSHGGHFTHCKEMSKLKKQLNIATWEEFVIDQRVITWIQNKLTPIATSKSAMSFQVICEGFWDVECKIALQEVDVSVPWIIQNYDDYEQISYLIRLSNNQYRDISKSIYEGDF